MGEEAKPVVTGVLLIALVAGWSAASAETPLGKTKCEIYKQFGCSAVKCTELDQPGKAWSVIDWDARDYDLCEPGNCQHFKFMPWEDGIYISLTLPGRDLMVKINTTDNSIVETSTVLNYTISSFGSCAKDEDEPK